MDKKSVISKIDYKFEDDGYMSLNAILSFFDYSDDLGWYHKIKGISKLFELYWIMNEELNCGDLFSDWCELMRNEFPYLTDALSKVDEYNSRIGIDLFSKEELIGWYKENEN